MSKVMIKDGLEYDKEFVLKMTKIRFLLDVAKSHTLMGDFVKAQRFFEKSKGLLKTHIECI